MGLEKRLYSVLVVSAQEAYASTFSDLLPETSYYPVRLSHSINSAKRALAERDYDFVIINSPLPDDMGTHFAIDTCKTKKCAVLVMVSAELHAEIHEKLYVHGIFTLQKPSSRPTLITALEWLQSARERLRGLEKKMTSIEEKMEEIRIVNRAKWILIRELKMEEPEAHRYIEKQAMDNCIAKRSVAEAIIKTYS